MSLYSTTRRPGPRKSSDDVYWRRFQRERPWLHQDTTPKVVIGHQMTGQIQLELDHRERLISQNADLALAQRFLLRAVFVLGVIAAISGGALLAFLI